MHDQIILPEDNSNSKTFSAFQAVLAGFEEDWPQLAVKKAIATGGKVDGLKFGLRPIPPGKE
jgi:hypothetical protein